MATGDERLKVPKYFGEKGGWDGEIEPKRSDAFLGASSPGTPIDTRSDRPVETIRFLKHQIAHGFSKDPDKTTDDLEGEVAELQAQNFEKLSNILDDNNVSLIANQYLAFAEPAANLLEGMGVNCNRFPGGSMKIANPELLIDAIGADNLATLKGQAASVERGTVQSR